MIRRRRAYHLTLSFPVPTTSKAFTTPAPLFLPCKWLHQDHFSRFHIHALIYDIWFPLSDLLHSIWRTPGSLTSLHMTQLILFYGSIIFHCVYVPHLYPLTCQWTFRVLPCPSYCKQCCNEHGYTVLVAQSCLTFCDSTNCSPPGSPVHGILQARILE